MTSAAGEPSTTAEIVLYTRKACSLCEEARILLEDAASHHRVRVREVDVDHDPALVERYGAWVPVAALGDRELFRLQADPRAIARALEPHRRE